jgi:adenylyltransferase/sulfurtransferase
MSPSASRPLTADELQRYHRHLVLPGIGEEGQRRLRDSRVLIVGAGGLGSPAALYLAAAGVGRIGIVDADLVELSNLQRQILHDTTAVGTPKVDSARHRLREINPHVDVATYHVRLTSANALDLMREYDVVLDGTDNFATRYLISDACVILGKPNVHASVLRFDGQASVFSAGDAPCYRCLFPEPPEPGTVPNCEEGGVLGVLPGMMGVIQAMETIKLLTGIGEPLVGRLLLADVLRMEFRTIEIARDPMCPACGTREITTLIDYDAFCGTTTSENNLNTPAESEELQDDEISPTVLHTLLAKGAPIRIIDVREPYEWAIARLADARLIPLNSLPGVVHTLARDADIVVYCHHGMRSAAAVEWLRDQGFARVRNLVGGIDRWSLDIDPTMRRY